MVLFHWLPVAPLHVLQWYTLYNVHSISHQIPYNIKAHPFYNDFVSIFVIKSTGKYMYIEGHTPTYCMSFSQESHGLPHGYDNWMQTFYISLGYHFPSWLDECVHGIRPIQCWLSEAVLYFGNCAIGQCQVKCESEARPHSYNPALCQLHHEIIPGKELMVNLLDIFNLTNLQSSKFIQSDRKTSIFSYFSSFFLKFPRFCVYCRHICFSRLLSLGYVVHTSHCSAFT